MGPDDIISDLENTLASLRQHEPRNLFDQSMLLGSCASLVECVQLLERRGAWEVVEYRNDEVVNGFVQSHRNKASFFNLEHSEVPTDWLIGYFLNSAQVRLMAFLVDEI